MSIFSLKDTIQDTVFPQVSAKRMGAYWKEGGLLSFPVGNKAYLSYIIQFALRVINRLAKETRFPCIPTIKM